MEKWGMEVKLMKIYYFLKASVAMSVTSYSLMTHGVRTSENQQSQLLFFLYLLP